MAFQLGRGKNKCEFVRQKVEAQVTHKFVEVMGTKIHYIEWGQGPLIILVHGWTNNWYGFWPLIEHLEGFRVISLDLPGYGESGVLDGRYSIEVMAESIAEMLRALGEKAKTICALSMGSAVVASFGTKFSGLADSIILMGAPLVGSKKLHHKLFRCLMSYIVGGHSISRTIGKKIVSNYWYGHATAKFLNMYQYDKELIDMYGLEGRKAADKDALFDMGRSIAACKLDEIIAQLKLPTFLLYGRYDKLIDLDRACQLAEEKKNVSLGWVDEAGHIVCLEKPEECAASIRSFLQRLDR